MCVIMLAIQLSMLVTMEIISPWCDLDLKGLITRLEHDAALTIKWFESNYMMPDQDKCHFLFSGHIYETFV